MDRGIQTLVLLQLPRVPTPVTLFPSTLLSLPVTSIAALHMRFKTENDAINAAERYRRCPKVHFWGNKGQEAYIILKVPDGNRFWSDFIAKNPELSFGGTSAELVYLDRIVSEGIEVSYGKIEGDTAPCGSRCRTCPSYGKCSGCPSLNLGTL
jgi:hypothetical protein